MLVLDPRLYERLLRPVLFRLEPEAAQRLAELALELDPLWRAGAPFLRVRDRRLLVNVAGLTLPGPVGLAAGYDKDCRLLGALACMGWGYVVGGTVTADPRPGNPRPRVLRYPQREALVNSLGFPGKGLDAAYQALAASRRGTGDTPVWVSVAGTSVEEVALCLRRLEPLADAVEVNVSSPNTRGLAVFHQPANLRRLVEALHGVRTRPLMVKLPRATALGGPQEGMDRLRELARAAVEAGADGVTLGNTRPVEEPRLAVGRGGLSGRPLLEETEEMVAAVRRDLGPEVAINACGGVATGEDAWRLLRAGADTVQLLTALVYRGPGVVRRIHRELLERMEGRLPAYRG